MLRYDSKVSSALHIFPKEPDRIRTGKTQALISTSVEQLISPDEEEPTVVEEATDDSSHYPFGFQSLVSVLNQCKTKMGSRLMTSWLQSPSTDHNLLTARQLLVEYFYNAAGLRTLLRENRDYLLSCADYEKAGIGCSCIQS